jgi:hypothetical protein
MHLSKFVSSDTGRYVMSAILGLGLATIFREMCEGGTCLRRHAPPLEKINEQIYKFGNKCYRFEKIPVPCNKKKEIVSFE